MAPARAFPRFACEKQNPLALLGLEDKRVAGAPFAERLSGREWRREQLWRCHRLSLVSTSRKMRTPPYLDGCRRVLINSNKLNVNATKLRRERTPHYAVPL